MSVEKRTAIYLAGINSETMDRLDEPTADDEGHVIHATVLRHASEDNALAPVRVRIDHGVAASTAASMLRKMADMVESRPGMLSDEPGAAIRRLPTGETVRKLLTPKRLLAAAHLLEPEDRQKLLDLVERMREDLPKDSDDEDSDGEGPGFRVYGPDGPGLE